MRPRVKFDPGPTASHLRSSYVTQKVFLPTITVITITTITTIITVAAAATAITVFTFIFLSILLSGAYTSNISVINAISVALRKEF